MVIRPAVLLQEILRGALILGGFQVPVELDVGRHHAHGLVGQVAELPAGDVLPVVTVPEDLREDVVKDICIPDIELGPGGADLVCGSCWNQSQRKPHH